MKAVKVQQNYAESVENDTSAIKENTKAIKNNQKALAVYDELNVMQDNQDSSINKANTEVTKPLYQTVAVPFSKFADELRKAFGKGDYSSIAKIIAQNINSALSRINWSTIITAVKKIAENIATFLNAFISRIDWSLIGRTLAYGFRTALTFLYTLITDFNWSGLGEDIGKLINGALSKYNAGLFAKTLSNLFTGILTTLTQTVETIKWEKVSTTIVAFLSSVKWSNIGRVVIGFVNALSKALTSFNFKGVGEAFRKGISKINWKGIWNSIADLVSDLLKGITSLFGLKGISTVPLNNALRNISTPISNIFKTLKQTADTLIRPIINKFLPAVVNLIGDIIKGLDPIIKGLTPVLEKVINVSSNVIKSLSPVITSIGKLIGNIVNVLSPFFVPLGNIISAIANTLSPAISSITNFISMMLQPLTSISSLLGDVLGKFTAPFENETITEKMQTEINVLKTTSEELKGIVDDTKASIENTETALSGVGADTQQIDELSEKLKNLVEDGNISDDEQTEVKTIVDLLSEKVPAFQATWGKLVETDGQGKLKLKENKGVVDSIDEIINKYKEQYMTEALQDQYKELYAKKVENNKKIAEAQNEVIEAQGRMNELVQEYYDAKKDVDNSMGDGSAFDKAVARMNKADEAIQAYSDSFAKITQNFVKAKASQAEYETELKSLSSSVDVVSGKFKSAKGHLQAIRDTFERGLIDEATLKKQFGRTASQLYSQTKSMGENVDKGYNEGLKSAKNELVEGSVGAAKTALQTMKLTLREHSPSKATEEMGVNLAIGLVDKNGLNNVSVLENGFKTFRKNITTEMNKIKKTIKTQLFSIPKYFSYTFNGIWESIKPYFNKMLARFETFYNYLNKGLIRVISNLNSVSTTAEKLSGRRYIKFPTMNNITLPRYASGQVVPANYGEFTAILGDNKREPEVVSPLSTMKQALKEALEENGGSNDGDIVIPIYLDGDVLFKATVKANDKYKMRYGKSALA